MKGNRTFQTQVNQPSKVQIMKTPSLKTNRGLSRLCLATCMTLSLITSASGVDIITRWTFEGNTTDPAIGSGTASLIGGTTATFATGNGGGADGIRPPTLRKGPAQALLVCNSWSAH